MSEKTRKKKIKKINREKEISRELSEEELKDIEPGLLKKAASFGNAMMKTFYIKATKGDNEAFVSPEILEKRWQKCKSCKYLKKEKKQDRYYCAKCGCGCSGSDKQHSKWKNKLAHTSQSCPLNPKRWGPGDYIQGE